MLVKYCYITVLFKDGSSKFLQIEMKPHENGVYGEVTKEEVEKIANSLGEILHLSVEDFTWTTRFSHPNTLQ